MPFEIENKTHWRTDDIRKLLAAAVSRGGNTKLVRTVRVHHSNKDTYAISGDGLDIRITLCVVGPKRSPLRALAEASYDVPIVDPHAVARILNGLAYDFMHIDVGMMGDPVLRQHLLADRFSSAVPSWAPKGLVIRKYADPTKDTTYQRYVEKVEKDIANAERRVEQHTTALEKAKRGLNKAQRDLKKHQARLKSAKERRGL